MSSTFLLCGLGKVRNLSGLFLYLPIRDNNTYPTGELQKVSEMRRYKEIMSTMGVRKRKKGPLTLGTFHLFMKNLVIVLENIRIIPMAPVTQQKQIII